MFRPNPDAPAALEQDRAAGGNELRKLRLKNGDIVTASLKLSPVADRDALTAHLTFSVSLRFSSSGVTLQRNLGKVTATSKFAALKQAWALARSGDALEKDGWSWVS